MPAGNAHRRKLRTLREAVRAATYRDEAAAVRALLSSVDLSMAQRQRIMSRARDLVQACRARSAERSLLDSFLQEFGLSNEEGIALMCLAESLLRVPDARTAEELVADKLAAGNWTEHVGASESFFVTPLPGADPDRQRAVAVGAHHAGRGKLVRRPRVAARRGRGPGRRRARHAHPRRRLHPRPQHRRGTRQRAGRAVFVRHARRSRPDGGRRGAIPRCVSHGPGSDRRRIPRRHADDRLRHLGEAVGAASAPAPIPARHGPAGVVAQGRGARRRGRTSERTPDHRRRRGGATRTHPRHLRAPCPA